MKKFIFLWLMAASVALAKNSLDNGQIKLSANQLQLGQSFELAGNWLYKPGYAVAKSERPDSFINEENIFSVPVPQLLNRIRWWLDDSEDFNKHETERLKKFGFDTDRAEDGWYYLRLNVPALPANKHLFIVFDGVAMRSKTFCNGTLLGSHDGMFSRFGYDLTSHLKPGTNLVAVFVSMEKIPSSSLPMGEAVTVNLTASKVKSMSKGMFGPMSPNFQNRDYDLHGIWQPVKLVVRGPAKLDDVWFKPLLDGAEVRIETHSFVKGSPARLKAKWSDAKTGKVFAELPAEKIQLNTNSGSHTLTLRNVKPKLWTPAEPNLYRLEVTLESEAGEVLDKWTHNVGFRTFEARGNKFFLNDKPYWLRGANHLPYGKNPFDPALARKLIQYLHDANVRVTRTHATPWNEPWLDAADEIGLGVSLEGIRPWALAGKIGATPPDLFAHWLMENEDVVKRARNHPSVFIYTVGNEMMLRDTKNIEKWQQLSDVVKQTRKLDPARPVICSSEYSRDRDFYKESLKPNHIDDGDADDLHRYNNWYGPSSFVTDAKFEKEAKENGGMRPLMGQELSSGYPDLDTGLPVFRYTRDLLTPQAWVGNFAYPGNDPKIFLDHYRAVTKRWAERLRFERGDRTAGFMLFATECWFSHSYDAQTVKPYSVLSAIHEAYLPVGLALETGRRRFFPGEHIETAVFVTNDSETQKNFSNLRIEVSFLNRKTGKKIKAAEAGRVSKLDYFQTVRVPVQLVFPASATRRELALQIRLLEGKNEISRTTDCVEVIPAPQAIDLRTVLKYCESATNPDSSQKQPIYKSQLVEKRVPASVFSRGLGPELKNFLQITVRSKAANEAKDAQVLLFGSEDFDGLEKDGTLRKAIENGATAIVFSPGEKFTKLFSSEILDVKNAPGEYADWSPCAGTAFADNLGPMDLKWWGRTDDGRVFVANASHRLKSGSHARELIRYIPPHGYISEDKRAEQYRTVLFEIPLGHGRLWVCDLHLEASVSVDPAAQRFALNLLRAAADPNSTADLPRVPSHEELLKTVATKPK